MVDITPEINAFKNAVYGEDVRNALVKLATDLGTVVQSVEGSYAPQAFIKSSNYTSYFTDINDATINGSYFISASITSEMISNLPVYGISGIFIALPSMKTNDTVSVQLFIINSTSHENNFIYYRICKVGNVWSSWKKILTENDLTDLWCSDYAAAITSSNYETYGVTDLNNIKANTSMFINSSITENMIANMPSYDPTHKLLLVFSTIKDNYNTGCIQVLFETSGTSPIIVTNTYYRAVVLNTPTWTPWKKILTENDFENAWKLKYEVISSRTYNTYGITDLNNVIDNTAIFINATITEDMIANMPIYGTSYKLLFVFSTIKDNYTSGAVQILFDIRSSNSTVREIYYRAGVGNNITWSKWMPLTSGAAPSMMMHNTCKILKKVVCCGDSMTSGHISTGSGDLHRILNEEYAWPHFMEILTGNKWINCGRSGATTRSWLTDPRGLLKAQAEGVAQAYNIGLGINDGRTSGLELGTAADIGTDSDTFYAKYSQIIRELHNISPDAYIFVDTIPVAGIISETSGYEANIAIPYTAAIKEIAAAYKDDYNVHVLDLNAYSYLYKNNKILNNDDYINHHYTAVGYEQLAEIFAYVLSEYITNNISEFQRVYVIPYDE